MRNKFAYVDFFLYLCSRKDCKPIASIGKIVGKNRRNENI